jgi:hypothetical protein
MHRLFISLLLAAAALAPSWASAQPADFVPKPDTYLCPNTEGPAAVDCYLNAVEHLYTMCRQVKSIEIIEFGYEKSEEGTNGAKSEYCVDKQKSSINRPYQAALKETKPHRTVAEHLQALQQQWLAALQSLKWKPGETDEEYKARIGRPYESFKERAQAVRLALAEKFKTKTSSAAEPAHGVVPKPATKIAAKAPAKDAAKGATP